MSIDQAPVTEAFDFGGQEAFLQDERSCGELHIVQLELSQPDEETISEIEASIPHIPTPAFMPKKRPVYTVVNNDVPVKEKASTENKVISAEIEKGASPDSQKESDQAKKPKAPSKSKRKINYLEAEDSSFSIDEQIIKAFNINHRVLRKGQLLRAVIGRDNYDDADARPIKDVLDFLMHEGAVTQDEQGMYRLKNSAERAAAPDVNRQPLTLEEKLGAIGLNRFPNGI